MRSNVQLLLTTLYLLLALVPLGIALSPPRPFGATFWFEFALAVGYVGLGQMALQFGLIARFERLSRPLGIDRVLQWHAQVGMVAALMLLLHVLVLIGWQPANLRLLNPFSGDLAGTTGVLALAAILLLIALSIWRRQLRLGYEAWRVSHALLGIVALVLAQTHVTLIGHHANASWKNAALWAWCLLFAALIAYLRMVKPFQLARRAWRIADVQREAASTWSVALEPVGHSGMPFAPGQFAWLKIGTNPWSANEHPFSLASSGEHPERIEFAIKELGDFTSGIGTVTVGTKVYVDGPHGSFSCDFKPAERLVFIAGGIGIAPFLSMIRTLAERSDKRPITLVYACSSIERVAFRSELEMRSERPNFALVLVLEHPHPGWEGPAGYITRDLMAPIVAEDTGTTLYMICGPDVMMTAVERMLHELGVPGRRVDMERFDIV